MLKLIMAAFLLSTTLSSSYAEQGSQTEKAKDNESEDDEIFQEQEINDPLEYLNRGVYFINSAIDACLMKPLAIGYRLGFPEVVRDRIGDFLAHLRSPISFINHVLQAEPKRAFHTFSRFVINTGMGFLGTVDAAKHFGIPGVETNFNETLGRWGIDTGPYLIIPVIGSSSFRGAVGLGVDYYSDPINLYFLKPSSQDQIWISYTRSGVNAVHERNKYLEEIDRLMEESEDMYATLRSIYFQQLKSKLEKLSQRDKEEDADAINTQDDIPASQQSLF
jgi:phospholipid-binding lipoprotein MlaA